jgi:hypothetical protein
MTKSVLDAICRVLDVEVEGVLVYAEERSNPTESSVVTFGRLDMSWINNHKSGWRLAVLVLLLVAIIGPWTFDRILVPSEYRCSAPFVRLEGDYCGKPLSGMWVFALLAGGLLNTGVRLITGAIAFTDLVSEARFVLLAGLILFLLTLPAFSSLFFILGGDRQRRQVFHVAAWGLAAAAGLLLGVSGFSRLHGAVWGFWLYTGLATSALILEGLLLARGRRASWE